MPSMSAIVITPDTPASVAATIRCLQAQTVAHDLELVLVGPGVADHATDPGLTSTFAAVRAVAVENMNSASRARAAGIRAATSPVVVLTEDHSSPEPDWAEALIEAHREPWAVVGPAMLNANPDSILSWANFVIEYGEWQAPAATGESDHLPGHNSSYKRDLLLAMGDRLEPALEVESLLHWQLRQQGQRLLLDGRARTHHLNFSRLMSSLALRFHCGHMFAGMRASRWPLHRRLGYAVAWPLIPPIRLTRIIHQLRCRGRSGGFVGHLLPALLLLLYVDAAGELVGYLFGPGEAPRRIADIDFDRPRFLNRHDRKRLEAT